MEQSFNSTLSPPSSLTHSRVTEADPLATSFAFLVHSQDTIPRNLPPSVDNKPLARQRRRRTSPEDQAILEAEFQRDSKPDKDARRRIVERVALGEKEVQIWFQNRRQNKRRKSQPPISYEILPHLEPAPSDSSSSPADEVLDASPPYTQQISNDTKATLAGSASSSFVSSQDTRLVEPSSNHSDAQGQAPLSATSEVSNRGSLEDSSVMPGTQDTVISNATPPSLERVASRVRLSMTSSGGARIISGAETTPSPPRSQPLAPTPFATRQTLRRSYSAAGFQEPHDKRNSFSGLLRRQPSGRSRDSRAWEFWCDSDARNGLVKKAQQETTGSAADAISLIRSSNSRGRPGVLTPNFNRSNSAILSHRDNGAKRVKKTHHDDWEVGVGSSKAAARRAKDAKLQRAMSSVARLQAAPQKHEKKDIDAVSVSSRSDSDKENREPTTSGLGQAGQRMQRHGRANHNACRAVLGESRTVPGFGTKARHGLGIHAAQHVNYAWSAELGGVTDPDPEDDDEIAQFMHGGGADGESEGSTGSSGSCSGDEDNDEMDCVAGLLSLSQGNWR